MQLGLVAFVLARGVGIEAAPVKWLLVAAAAATTVASGLSYLVRWTCIFTRRDAAL